jgi:hypothetical protein
LPVNPDFESPERLPLVAPRRQKRLDELGHAGGFRTRQLDNLILRLRGRDVAKAPSALFMKTALILVPLLTLLILAFAWAIYAWNSIEVEMSVHGYVAMVLGIVFSLAVGCRLMALMFYSSRHGYDEHDRR